jgi:carboxylesterase type B
MWHAMAGNRAFEFQFDRVPPGRESVDATHGAELEYVFDTFGSRMRTPAARYDAADHAVSDAMQQY